MRGTTTTKGLLVRSLEQTLGYLSEALEGLTQQESARRAKVSQNTASTNIKVLIAEGSLENSCRIGNAKLFRLRGGG